MDYQFLLGRAFRFKDLDFVASALGTADGVTIVRASTTVNGEPVMETFRASEVIHHLVCDEEIELREVSFAR